MTEIEIDVNTNENFKSQSYLWRNFLNARFLVIRWMLYGKKYSFEQVAELLSMDAEQVRLIANYKGK